MSLCSNCPAQVINVIAGQVSDILGRVERMQELTVNFNAAFLRTLTVTIQDDLNAWIAAIPLPPVIDLTSILAYLTCPLTPLALNIDPLLLANMDPRQLYYLLVDEWNQTAIDVNAAYIQSTANLNSARLIQFAQLYMQELYQTMGDPFEFQLNLATATGYTAYISQVCPDLYINPQYPFAAFTAAITDFTFNGLLPNGIDPAVLPVLNMVVEAETRILGWKTLLTVVV